MKSRGVMICLAASLVLAGVWASGVAFSSKTIHIGMVVSDLPASVAFYKDVVGMVQVDRTSFDIDSEFGKRSGMTDGSPFHVEVLKLGSGEEATQLKLMSFGDKARKAAENEFIHSQTGIQYLTFLVENITPCLENIRKHGIKLLGETPTGLGDGKLFVLIQDPDGTFVELIGPAR